MKYCPNCGTQVNENAVVCVKCGVSLPNKDTQANNAENNKWLITLLLCIFFGYLGVHRFYVGKIGTGILQLITGGGCGVWTLIDFIMIILGSFTDAEGNPIKAK